MWAPKGRQPEILSKPGRAKVDLFGAANPATGELFFKEAHRTSMLKRLLAFDYPLELFTTVVSFPVEDKGPNEILQKLCTIN